MCINTLEGHTGSVYHAIIFKNQLISCSYDYTIKIWDTKTWDCLKTLIHGNVVWKVFEFGMN